MAGPLSRWVLALVWVGAVAGALVWADTGGVDTTDRTPVVASVSLGVGFAVTAVLLRNQVGQRGNSELFALLAVLWVAGQAGLHGVGELTVLCVFVSAFVQVVGAAALLRYPGEQIDRPGRVLLGTLAVTLGVIQVGLIVTGTPSTWEEPIPDVPWPSWWAAGAVHDGFEYAKFAVWTLGGVVFLVLLARRWRQLPPIDRRSLAPILLAACLIAALTIAGALRYVVPASGERVLVLGRAYSGVAVAIAFVLSAVQLRMARGAVADLAADLSQSLTIEHVRASLRRALGDESLDVWYALPDRDQYVDCDGRIQRGADEEHRLVVEVRSGQGEPLALVIADPGLRRHPALVDAAVAVSRLAMENAQLQANLRAQLREVHQARARLLHSGLEQRRRLERDLHDGAQQRLLALGMRLGVLENESTDPATASAIQVANKELGEALQELRDLAHGLYPAVLSQAGLRPALEAVTERLPVPITAHVSPERWHPDVESAAYLIACEALTNACKHAGASSIRLDVHPEGDQLVVAVDDDGTGTPELEAAAGLESIRDRVSALGGRVEVTSRPDSGTRVLARVPCE